MVAAIVGAGDLGAALAYTLATRDRLREIRVIDEGGTVAAGKALDILQSGPIHRSSTRVAGTADLNGVRGAEVVVLADPLEPPDAAAGKRREIQGEAGLALIRRITSLEPDAALVCSGAAQAWMVERAVTELGLDPRRVLGSAPAALHAAARMLIALECGGSPHDVAVALAGVPSDGLLIGWESASIHGEPIVERLTPHSRSRVASRIAALWPPAPIALAHAAARSVEGLAFGSDRSQHAFAVIDSADPSRPSGARVMLASVRLGRGRITDIALPALSGREQLALDNLLMRTGPV
jgi:malate/lactate dehydrogenase